MRRLPLQAGQPRQRQAVRRAAQRDRDRLRRLPRHACSQLRRTLVTSGPGARELPGPTPGTAQRGRNLLSGLELARTPFGTAAFRRTAGDVLIQRSMVDARTCHGRCRRSWTRSRRVSRASTTRDDAQAGEDACSATAETLGRRPTATAEPRARRREHDLQSVPLVVDHELLRLPSVADRQPEAADAAQRGARRRATGPVTTSRCCATTSTCSARTAASSAARISPVRSSSAVVVSSQDLNRQWIYYQQQTVSAEGYAGQAFNTHVPHTVRDDRNQDVHRLPRLGRAATTTR